MDQLLEAIKRRGPDGTTSWLGDGAALGFSLLATTPEAASEVLPFTDDSTSCTIVADVRLDNREELIAALALPTVSNGIGDGELILRAYGAWGRDCPGRLLGDFAFAIWDAQAGTLFCARDHMGMRQLAYAYRAGEKFVFATEASAIAASQSITCEVNEDRLTDYLSNFEGADLVTTFYEGVLRLPPAHCLTISPAGLNIDCYWRLQPQPVLQLNSDEEYARAFHEVLAKAVTCRLRSNGQVGASLSGGLDSNSIVAIAAPALCGVPNGPLTTISGIGADSHTCLETFTIRTAISRPDVRPICVNYSDVGPLRTKLIELTRNAAEPFDAAMVLIRALYIAAQGSEIRVVLDGAAADTVLSSNFHTASLLRRGHIFAALREEKGRCKFWASGGTSWYGLARAAFQAFAPLALRRARFCFAQLRSERLFLAEAARIVPFLNLKRARRRRSRIRKRELAHLTIDALTHLRAVLHPNLVVARERYDRVAAACGVEPRDPFLDLRVVQFCLSLPPEQRQRDGWPKWILRQAMSEKLPPAIRWRRGKQHLGTAFIEAIRCDLEGIKPADNGVYFSDNDVKAESLFLLSWFKTHAGATPIAGSS